MYGYHKDDAIIFKIGEVQKLEDCYENRKY